MAELNFGLLNPPGSQSIGNAFVTGMGQAQEARARDLQMQQSVRQGQMAELQYKKAQDTEAKLNQFYASVGANGGPKDPVAIEDAMINSGIQQVANTGLAARMTRLGVERDRRLFSEANMPPGAAPGLPAISTPQPPADGSAPASTATNALLGTAPAAPSNALAALVARRDRNIALGTAQGIKNAELIQKDIDNENKRYPVGSSLLSGTGAVVGTAPEATSQDIRTMRELGYPLTPAGFTSFRNAHSPDKIPTPPSMVAEYTFAKTPDGGNFEGTYQDFVTARASAGRAPPQPRAESPTEKVIDPVTGKQIIVSREEAIRGRMTPAAAMESLPPKEIQKREAALPAATSAVNGFDTKAKSFIEDLIALRDDVGLDQITGPIYGRTGSVSRAGSRAQALYDKIVAKGGFQALQDLRDASKTGGALGNVSNQEGKQLTASFAAIDQRQNAKDVQAAINQAIADIEGARTRTREAYDSTYSYKSSGGNTPTAPAVNIDALLDKYK